MKTNKEIAEGLEKDLPKLTLTEALNRNNLETGDYMLEFHHVGAAATTWLKVRRHPFYQDVAVTKANGKPLTREDGTPVVVGRTFFQDTIHQIVTNTPRTIKVGGRQMQVVDSLRGRKAAERWVEAAELDNPDRFTGRFKVISQAHQPEIS